MFFFNPWWPLAVLDAVNKARQARRAAFYLSACFNPVLAWWLLLSDKAENQASDPAPKDDSKNLTVPSNDQPA